MPAQIPANPSFPDMPEGTVTFLFTDIEGSTQLLARLRDRYAVLLADQRRILRAAFAHRNGHEVDTQGDAFFVAFSRASEAVSAAVEAQRGLAGHAWPDDVAVRVRMGIHTGEPWNGEEGYVGMDVHRAARIAHVGHGGQVLLSETTTSLVSDELPAGVSLVDLGQHLLKDIHRPNHIYQLVIDGLTSDFPALKSLGILPPLGSRLPRQVGRSPYRGLSAFQEADAAFYFGRETFIDRLESAVNTRKFVAVIVGSSGSGKSSALFAGLLPRLRKSGGYQFAIFRPGNQPFYALASALLPLLEPGLSETDRLAEIRKMAERLERGEISIAQIVARVREKSAESRQILLVIDQFEELYTMNSDDRLRSGFIDVLLAGIEAAKEQREPSIIVLITLRADFMGQALTHRPFADALQESSLLMGPMNHQEMHMAIEKPAEIQGAAFEPGLVERILDEVGEKPGVLPLLEFTLTLLWERQTDGWLNHTDYEAMGSVEGALADYADQVFIALQEGEQELARSAMVQLVQPGGGTEDTRRLATRQELGDKKWKLLQHLADKRLVVTGQDAGGHETVEVIHEALIQKWGRFREWMDADRAFRAWQERLRSNLRQWQESQQDEGALLGGTPLSVAQSWLAERGEDLSQVETEYIAASQALQLKRSRESQQRRRRLVIGLAAGLLIALLLAGYAVLQRQNSLHQASILLAGQAESLVEDGFYDRGVLLAMAAVENFPYTAQAEYALGMAVSNNRALQQYNGHTGSLTSLDWSPDGSKIVSSSSDNTIHIWDAATGQTLQEIILPKGITGNIFDMALAAAWTPDGKHIVTLSGDRFLLGSQDFDLIIWDSATGQQVKAIEIPNLAEPEEGEEVGTTSNHYPTGQAASFAPKSGRLATLGGDNTAIVWDAGIERPELTLSGHENDVNGIAWSPDERQLATVSEDGTVRLWDAASGAPGLVLSGHEGAVNTVVWSPDGERLATGGDDKTARIWDVKSGEVLHTINPQGGIIWSLDWSPDELLLAIGSDDRQVRLWDLANNALFGTLSGHNDFITDLDWSNLDGRLASAGNDGLGRVWQANPQTLIMLPYTYSSALDWTPDSRFLAIPYGDPFREETPWGVGIWDTTSGELTKMPTEFNYANMESTYSPDGRLLLVRGLGSLPEGFVNANPAFVVDAASGKTVHELNSSDGKYLRDADWSPDGKRIVTASIEGTIDIWDDQSGALIRTMQHGNKAFINQVEWSPDGKKIVSAGGDAIARIWDAESGVELLSLLGHEPPTQVIGADWSPDGKRILTTSGNSDVGAPDNTARIWDANSGKALLVIDDHTAAISGGEWSPDGKRIATLSNDDTMRIWDATSGAEILRLYTPQAYGSDMKWSPDGKYIAVDSDAGQARIFRVWGSVEELLAYAQKCCVFRQLTPEERQQFGLP